MLFCSHMSTCPPWSPGSKCHYINRAQTKKKIFRIRRAISKNKPKPTKTPERISVKCSLLLHLPWAEGPANIHPFLNPTLSLPFRLTWVFVVGLGFFFEFCWGFVFVFVFYYHPRITQHELHSSERPGEEDNAGSIPQSFQRFWVVIFNQSQNIVCLKLKK